ncbi:MAG: hypothetical protein R2873_15020 [Caldilineaceae bacterium]
MVDRKRLGDWGIEDLADLVNVLRQQEAVARSEAEWVDVDPHNLS